MKKIKDYACPRCNSNNIIREGREDSDNIEDYYEYTCADCGYNLTWYSGDYSEEYGWMTEEKFHKVWDSGLYDSDDLVSIDNKVTQEILHDK